MQNILRAGLNWLGILLLLATTPSLAQNLALNKTATATSGTASLAFDGKGNTRWESASTDIQSIVVDLGSVQTIDRIRLTWENAYGKDFTLEVSNDQQTWTVVRAVTNNATTANEYVNLKTSGRYVKMNGTKRATTYGFSLFEFEVFNYSNNDNNLALGRPAVASSTQGGLYTASAFDADYTTRWGSTVNLNAASLYVDLGGKSTLSRVYLVWETAYGADYTIDVSDDATTWTTVYSVTGNTLHFNEITFAKPASGRYIRMNGTKRGNTGADFGFSLYEFQVTGTTPVPLPVTLASFGAARQATGVEVNWATASELNNAGFEVQRSAYGAAFTTLAKVAGAGTSQVSHRYIYFDAAPLRTTSYYRLRQLDTDGTATYGPVVAVQALAAGSATLHVYPNPAIDHATLEWEASARPTSWYLTNSTGQVVHSELLSLQSDLTSLPLDLQAYPAGSYVLTVETPGQAARHTRVQKVN
ncbi:T9SS type A sorting domain-containing protein [Hymenobacter sp. HMF4947]|uniref:T9SS type A sorting domain-containing protein n=1 Tax=Hymenobacter ginkgonis TaxID=2682976 RepID=A0A7K1TFL0_9BACT|nr:discoidin domain-containing protein [Hymenobacter ginkgonis]MVN77204.1 T9SS type A sorting domain-containing protein [Hymenobacter ginkgonis]